MALLCCLAIAWSFCCTIRNLEMESLRWTLSRDWVEVSLDHHLVAHGLQI